MITTARLKIKRVDLCMLVGPTNLKFMKRFSELPK